ncbi:MAG: phage holin family protein [Alistipes sp.]|nr:phage holin family protein [Alistipes sp.]
MEALYRYFSGALLSLAALFAPVVPMVWCVAGFILFDFLTGVWASKVESREQGKEWYFESRLAWHTAQKLGFTIIALCMAFVIDTMILDFLEMNLTKLFAGFVCGVEMWSFLENACRISDAPLLRYIKRYVKQKVREEAER